MSEQWNTAIGWFVAIGNWLICATAIVMLVITIANGSAWAPVMAVSAVMTGTLGFMVTSELRGQR